MSLEVGDVIPTEYTVRDAAGLLVDATVTATGLSPAGVVVAMTPAHVSTGLYRAGLPTAGGTAGVWSWTYSASGTVTDETSGAAYVPAAGAALPWVPSPATVAALVPTRTLNQSPTDPTDPTYLGTFTDATIPTAIQADVITGMAVAWVLGQVGTVLPAFYPLAESAAAMRAAGLILTAYPIEEAGAPDGTAQRWLDQATAALKTLAAANAGAGGTGPGDTVPLLGSACFPPALPWLDPAYGTRYPQPW